MKTRTLLFLLTVAAVLLMATATSYSDAPPADASRVLAGGQYVLTIQAPVVTQPAGYRWVDAAGRHAVIGAGGGYRLLAPAQPATDGSGCCCKCYLPVILKRR